MSLPPVRHLRRFRSTSLVRSSAGETSVIRVIRAIRESRGGQSRPGPFEMKL